MPTGKRRSTIGIRKKSFIHSFKKTFIDDPLNNRHLNVDKHTKIVKVEEETKKINFC